MTIDTSTAVGAVSLEAAKQHLRVDWSGEDDLIRSLILAATQMAEHELQRALITRGGVEGFGSDPEDVPAGVRQWILMQVAHFYEQRQAATAGELKPLPFIGALLAPYRTWT